MKRNKNERPERWEQPVYSALTEETLIATGWVNDGFNGDVCEVEVHRFNLNHFIKHVHGYWWVAATSLSDVFVSPQAGSK